MIIGIGTDLCDIRRIERALLRFEERFTNRIFDSSERETQRSRAGLGSNRSPHALNHDAQPCWIHTGRTGRRGRARPGGPGAFA